MADDSVWELMGSMVTANQDEALRCLVARSGDEVCLRLLCYGDSLTAGLHSGDLFSPYGETLQLSLDRAVELWICGLCGETAVNLAERMHAEEICGVKTRLCGQTWNRSGPGLQRLLQDHGFFDLVLVVAGTNDIYVNVAPERVVAAIQDLHRACHLAGSRTVVLSLPPSSCTADGNAEEKSRHEVNDLLQQWATSQAATQQGVALYVDLNILMPFSTENGLWDADGLHFSKAGSRSLGMKLAALIGWLLDENAP